MKNKLGSLTQKMWLMVIATVVLGLLSISVLSQEKQSGGKNTINQTQGKQSDQGKKSDKGKAKGAGPQNNGKNDPPGCVMDTGDSEPKIAMNTGGEKTRIYYTGNTPIIVMVPNCNSDFDLPVNFVLKGKGIWSYRFVEMPNSRVLLANPLEKSRIFTVETKTDCEEKSVIGRLRINRDVLLRRSNFEIKVELLQSANGNISTMRQTGAAIPASGWQVRKSFTFIVDCGSTRITPLEAKPAPIKR